MKVAIVENGWGKYISYAWTGGCMDYIKEHGLDVNLYVFNSFGNFSLDEKYNAGEFNITRLPDFKEYDGIILELTNLEDAKIKQEIIDRVIASGVPAISLVEPAPGIQYVGIDNYGAMRQIVEHIVGVHGCKRVNYVGGPEHSEENRERFQAYKDVLREHGIEFDEAYVYQHNYGIATGEEAFYEFQKRNTMGEAFICANDNIAVGLCHEAQMNGYVIPRDFMVTGFDNFDKASVYSPRISTIGFIREDIAYVAMETLSRIWNGEKNPVPSPVPTEAVFQESCGCVPAHTKSRGQYVIDRILGDEEETKLQNHMMQLKRTLINCNSFQEMAECLPQSLKTLEFEELFIVMNRDILECSDYLDMEGDDNQHYIVEGYPDDMVVLLATMKDTVLTDLTWSRNQLIPGENPDETGNIFLFSPLHFRDREIGYLVLKNCFGLMDSQMLFEVINVFLETMENMYQRMILNKMNHELSMLYMLDSLTGLYNRMAYSKLAVPAFDSCISRGKPVAVIFIDQDKLKFINDTYGHDMGNMAIKGIASTIQSCCPQEGIAMRYGGDEFLLLLPECDEEGAKAMIAKLQEQIAEKSQSLDDIIPVEASMGYAVATDSSMDLNACINLADERMYENKKARKAERK